MRKVVLAAILLALAACGKPSNSGGGTSTFTVASDPNSLSRSDKNQIGEALTAQLRSAGNELPLVGRCAAWFDFETGQVSDYTIAGNTGSAVITIPMTLRPGITREAGFQNLRFCYGSNPERIVSGLKINVTWQVGVERWNSGWRVGMPVLADGRVAVISRPPPVPTITFNFANSSHLQISAIKGQAQGSNANSYADLSFAFGTSIDPGVQRPIVFDNPTNACVWTMTVIFNTYSLDHGWTKFERTLQSHNLCDGPTIVVTDADGPPHSPGPFEPGGALYRQSANSSSTPGTDCQPFSFEHHTCVLTHSTRILQAPGTPSGYSTCFTQGNGLKIKRVLPNGTLEPFDRNNLGSPVDGYEFTPVRPPFTITYYIAETC